MFSVYVLLLLCTYSVNSNSRSNNTVVCHGVGAEVSECELKCLAVADVKQLEADCFWCFSKLLDGIQDYYTFAQPGIQKRVNSLKDLVSRIDSQCRRIISRYV